MQGSSLCIIILAVERVGDGRKVREWLVMIHTLDPSPPIDLEVRLKFQAVFRLRHAPGDKCLWIRGDDGDTVAWAGGLVRGDQRRRSVRELLSPACLAHVQQKFAPGARGDEAAWALC